MYLREWQTIVFNGPVAGEMGAELHVSRNDRKYDLWLKITIILSVEKKTSEII